MMTHKIKPKKRKLGYDWTKPVANSIEADKMVELRMRCLQEANHQSAGFPSDEIVKSAQAFYKFCTSK